MCNVNRIDRCIHKRADMIFVVVRQASSCGESKEQMQEIYRCWETLSELLRDWREEPDGASDAI